MIKKIDQSLIQQLIKQAEESPRLRSNINFHTEMHDPVQRLLIGLVRGTYVKPHNHPAANKWELLLAVRGEMHLVIFSEEGDVLEKIAVSPGDSMMGAEMPPGTWHTLYPVSEDAVFLELKAGPYTPASPDDFASWAPDEGTPEAQDFLSWVERAERGNRYRTA